MTRVEDVDVPRACCRERTESMLGVLSQPSLVEHRPVGDAPNLPDRALIEA